MKLLHVAVARVIAMALGFGSYPPAMEAGQMPMTGTDIPALRGIDQVVTNFMNAYGVPGAAFGLVKDGRLIFVRGYGYADTSTGELVQPDSLFRLASLSKSITAAATLKLVEQGVLSLSQPAFGVLGYAPPTYPGAAVDSRLSSITVRQLLNHTGGWDRNVAQDPNGSSGFDPTVNWTVRAATDMGVSAPADATTVVRWMIGKPLQFDPGTQYQYSNFGYTVLGRIIEKLSGQSYEQFARNLLAQAGVARMRIAGSRPADKATGEVTYYDYPGALPVASIFPQDTGPVPLPYNFSYSTMDSHGGWIANAIELLRFITAVDNRPSPPDILSSSSIATMISRPSPPWGPTDEPYYGMGWLVRNTPDNWWHTGALPGTATEMVRAGNGFSWVILLNFRAYRDDNNFFADVDNLGWQALASVSQWPTNDLFNATLSYDAWKANHFTAAELIDASISGDAADPDGDGLANLVEYALGSDPKTADRTGHPAPMIQTLNGQPYLTLSFRRLLLAYEISYTVEVSDDLVHWRSTAQPVGNPTLGQDGFLTETYRDETPIGYGTSARFLRVSIARLPR